MNGYKRYPLTRILNKHKLLLRFWSDPYSGTFRERLLDDFIRALIDGTCISNEKCNEMFMQLMIIFSKPELSGLLCFGKSTIEELMEGKASLSMLHRRILWMVWSVVFKPKNLKNAMSILTFGRMGHKNPYTKRYVPGYEI